VKLTRHAKILGVRSISPRIGSADEENVHTGIVELGHGFEQDGQTFATELVCNEQEDYSIGRKPQLLTGFCTMSFRNPLVELDRVVAVVYDHASVAGKTVDPFDVGGYLVRNGDGQLRRRRREVAPLEGEDHLVMRQILPEGTTSKAIAGHEVPTLEPSGMDRTDPGDICIHIADTEADNVIVPGIEPAIDIARERQEPERPGNPSARNHLFTDVIQPFVFELLGIDRDVVVRPVMAGRFVDDPFDAPAAMAARKDEREIHRCGR
jgi:hypothetical protein